MKTILGKIMIAVFAVLVSACGEPARDVVTRMAAQSAPVGVYSILPDTFRSKSIGVTIFANQYGQTDVADWRINRFAENETVAQLRRSGVSGAQVLELPNRVQARNDLTNFMTGTQREALAPVFARAAALGMPYLVVVEPGVGAEPADPEPPYGYWQSTVAGNVGLRFIYTNIDLRIYDVATRENISFAALRGTMPPDNYFFSQPFSPVSGAKYESVPFRPDGDYSAAERTQLRRDISQLIRARIAASGIATP